jgi:hypothetical protein
MQWLPLQGSQLSGEDGHCLYLQVYEHYKGEAQDATRVKETDHLFNHSHIIGNPKILLGFWGLLLT